MSKKDKIIFAFIGFIIFCVLFWMFPYQIIKYNLLPEHQVHVEWTVYSNSGPLNYQGTYKMKGNNFTSRYQSYKGSNTVCVEDDDANLFIGDQRVCIYVGTNDVHINKIEIVE